MANAGEFVRYRPYVAPVLADAAGRRYKRAMSAYPRALRLFAVPFLLTGLALPAIGQNAKPAVVVPPEAQQVDHTAWLYKGSDLTPDPEWHFGTLPNGVRYAVRKNGVPPGQVAIRVRIDAGSLMESESERGFAHFIEHITFRGSEYVSDGEAKRTWQRLGASFGTDSNAETTPTGTTYRLDLPSATVEGLDESLKILSGMMEKPNITVAGLNAERPVVLAEQRTAPGPAVRYGDAARALFFAGQPLADRSPIGNIKTLEAATPAAVQAFHDRWYRPERAVVIISGDMDPAVFEQLVAKYFSGWKGVGPAPAEPDFGKPDPNAPVSAALAEPGLPTNVAMQVLRPWHFNNDTVVFNQNRMVDQIALQIISRRLEARARAGGSFLQAAVGLDDTSRSVNATLVNILPIGNDWEKALKDVRAVIADAQVTPPTQAEIDREVAGYDTALRAGVETAKVEAGAEQAETMAGAIDIRETTVSPATQYGVFEDARSKRIFTPARVLESTQRLFKGDATRALANTQTADPAATAKLAAALKADVSGLAGKRNAQAAVSFARLPNLGAPGKIVSREPVAGLDVEKIVFANGVRLLVSSQTSESGRVFVRVRFGGGYNQLPANRQSPAWAASAVIASGIGTLNEGDLDALTTGRRIGLSFGVDDDAFTLGALTNAADTPDQLRLMAAKLAVPGWDPHPVARVKSGILASYAGLDSSPDGVLSRDLDGLLHDGDPRWATPSPDQVRALDAKTFRAFWAPRLASGPIEVSVFGDITTDAAIKAVADSFGAMKPRPAALPPAPPVAFPAHNATPVMRTHDGAENQAVAVIAWPTGSGLDDVSDSRQLEVLAQIFTDRLFEKLRQGAGISYSPNVSSNWPDGAPGGGRIAAVGQVPPDKVDYFFQLSREIAADLAANPVSADELQRILLPFKQSVARAATSSQFWLGQLGGASYDDRRVAATRNIGRDLNAITAESLQAVAQKYLKPATDWTMEVLPKDYAAKAGAKVATKE